MLYLPGVPRQRNPGPVSIPKSLTKHVTDERRAGRSSGNPLIKDCTSSCFKKKGEQARALCSGEIILKGSKMIAPLPGHNSTRMCSQLVQRNKHSRKSPEKRCELRLTAAWNRQRREAMAAVTQAAYLLWRLLVHSFQKQNRKQNKKSCYSEFPEIIMAGANTCEHKVTNIHRKSDSSQYIMLLWDKQQSFQ